MKLRLSPSECHRHLMNSLKPSLSYSGGNVKKWREKFGRKLRELIGDMPARRPPLNPRTIWRREHELGTIEKVVFTSEPFSDAPCYVCIPRTSRPPHTFFICLQGHSTGMHNSIAVSRDDEKTPIAVEGDRDFALGCMKRGIAALCLEQRSFGERRELKQPGGEEHGCHDATMHALMLGRTLIGERVFDVDRAIDYLDLRGDADMNCIGVMGNSGGGTISLFSAALLPRIALAMPSSYFCTFRDSIMSIFHCMDNYIPRLLKYGEMADVMGLFAPKPVVIVAGREDGIFPIAGTKRAFRRLKRIYAAWGAADRCHLVIGPEGHRFYADLAWPVMLREVRRINPRFGSGKSPS